MTTLELADGICLRAGRIAAAEVELLPWIGEFERREGWAGHGLLSCAQWLSWRTGLSPGAAREQVRVARRLEDLPTLAEAFAAGRVSYSKIRAITRVAEPDDGRDWVELARHSTGSQLERLVRGVRRAVANEAAEADPEGSAWSLRTRIRWDDQGNFTLTVSGPPQYLPMIQAGIDAKKAELQRQRDAEAAEDVDEAPADADVAAVPERDQPEPGVPAGTSQPVPDEVARSSPATSGLDPGESGWPAGTAIRDVGAAMASFFCSQDRLRQEQTEPTDRRSPCRPVPDAALPPPSAEPRQAGAAGVPAETPNAVKVTDAEALLALAQEALAAEQATHPGIARRRRPQLTVQIDPLSGWARQSDGELPGAVDGERCRFPGCTRHKKLHAHHDRYWADGGATDLDNLVLVCARHHTLIHSQAFSLVLHPDRRLAVHTTDGVPLLHHPAPPWGDPAQLAHGCGQDVSAETLPPDHVDARIDLGYAVSVLLAQAS